MAERNYKEQQDYDDELYSTIPSMFFSEDKIEQFDIDFNKLKLEFNHLKSEIYDQYDFLMKEFKNKIKNNYPEKCEQTFSLFYIPSKNDYLSKLEIQFSKLPYPNEK